MMKYQTPSVEFVICERADIVTASESNFNTDWLKPLDLGDGE